MCGVVQGDITSPFYFILALDLILRRHDKVRGSGVTLLQTIVNSLSYADDVVLAEYGDAAGIRRATKRLTSIAKGSRLDADMEVKLSKTKTLHCRAQDGITATTNAEAAKVCKFKCPHPGCGFVFKTKRGLQIHVGRCEWKDEAPIERILACEGHICNRTYKVRWAGFTEDADTWLSRSCLHPDAIKDFELANGLYVHD